jgi:DNA primase
LLAHAAADVDLGNAEGRSRMLALARPLWQALPDGALQRQLLGDLARAAQLTPEDLGSMWRVERPDSAPRSAAPSGGSRQPPLARPRSRISGRPMPAGSGDLAVRLLLRHAEWWDRLTAEDHQLLHSLGGEHGALVGWLEQQITDHGVQTWAALDGALEGLDLHPAARRIVDPGSLDDRHEFDDLQRVLRRMWTVELNEQAQALIALGPTEREQLDRIAELRERIRQIKQDLAAPAAGAAP